MYISVQNEFFDFSEEIKNFTATLDNIGALVTFTGIVRGQKSKTLDYMLIEHYPGMTETQIKLIVEETFKRWKKLSKLSIKLFGLYNLCLASSNESEKNLKSLGASKV